MWNIERGAGLREGERWYQSKRMLLTLLLDLPDLLHSLLEDGTLVRLDVEVIHVVDVGEDQLGQLLDVLVLLLPVPPLCAPLGAAAQGSGSGPPTTTQVSIS